MFLGKWYFIRTKCPMFVVSDLQIGGIYQTMRRLLLFLFFLLMSLLADFEEASLCGRIRSVIAGSLDLLCRNFWKSLVYGNCWTISCLWKMFGNLLFMENV